MKMKKTQTRLQKSLQKKTITQGENMKISEMEDVLDQRHIAPKIRFTAGGWPVPDFRYIIPEDIFGKIIAQCDRIKIESASGRKASTFSLKDNIRGGMVIPHMHTVDEIVLFDKAAMKNYFQAVAESIDKIEDISDPAVYLRF